MMTRAERIEYEILDYTLTRSSSPQGWQTNLEQFLAQLRDLFPDAEQLELIAAFKRLTIQGALTLRKIEPDGSSIYHDYRGSFDDEAFFGETRSELWFHEAPRSRYRFTNLMAMVTPPHGVKLPGKRKQ